MSPLVFTHTHAALAHVLQFANSKGSREGESGAGCLNWIVADKIIITREIKAQTKVLCIMVDKMGKSY